MSDTRASRPPPTVVATGGAPVPPVGGDASATGSLWRDATQALVRSPLFLVSTSMLAVVVAMALVPGWFTDADPRACDLSRSLGRPGPGAWFGHDLQGCDYFARTVHGARASVAVGLGATAAATGVALVFGTLAGYLGGWVDAVIGRVTDVWFAIPAVLGGIVLLTVLDGRGVREVALVLSLLGWPTMLRLMRSSVLEVARRDYITAARALGAGDLRIMWRHVIPNAVSPLLVYATLFVGVVITAEASLTFLGVGLQLPAISWGLAISAAQHRVLDAPHLLLFPGLFLSATVLAFVLLGDALRDALDPRMR